MIECWVKSSSSSRRGPVRRRVTGISTPHPALTVVVGAKEVCPVKLTDLRIVRDDASAIQADILVGRDGPGEDDLPDSGALTAASPHANVSFVPLVAGKLRYLVRVGGGSSAGPYVRTVAESEVNTTVTIHGAACYDFSSRLASQASEISLELDDSWIVVRF